jgi:hypothetical protein
MDHDIIVEQLLDRRKGFIESILQAPDLHHVASASLAIFTQMRAVAQDILQAKITLEAQQLKRADVTPCCPEADVTCVHTRTVSSETLFGEITIPVRTFQCHDCGATFRPNDAALGVPGAGEFTDDVRYLYAPLAAELPHRVANTLFARCTGVWSGIVKLTGTVKLTFLATMTGYQGGGGTLCVALMRLPLYPSPPARPEIVASSPGGTRGLGGSGAAGGSVGQSVRTRRESLARVLKT